MTDHTLRSRRLLATLLLVTLGACRTSTPAASAPRGTPAIDPDLAVLAPTTSDVPRPTATAKAATVLSLVELRACAVRVVDLDRSDGLIKAERSRVERERMRSERLKDSLEIVRPFVNTKSKAAVDAFNQRIDGQRSDQQAVDAATERLNRSVTEDGSSRAAFSAACGARPYRRSQNASLPPALRAAIDKNSCAGFVPVRDR